MYKSQYFLICNLDHPVGAKWIDSNGLEITDIPWAANQPNTSVNCAVIDFTLN